MKTQYDELPDDCYLASNVREFDRVMIQENAVPGIVLMERAGQAVFDLIKTGWPDIKVLMIVCGIGNNAGDGFIIARLALQAGLKVVIIQCGDPSKIKDDALLAKNGFLYSGGKIECFSGVLPVGLYLLVDALFGTGLEREITGDWALVINQINQSACDVVSVDIPSGLNSDNGAVMGVAVQATATVSFIGLKQGMFTAEGKQCCGQINFDDLGVPQSVYQNTKEDARLIKYAHFKKYLIPRRQSVHKGQNGHVLLIGGNYGYAGAIRMAAEACLRVGAGLVSVVTRPGNAVIINSHTPEIMCHEMDELTELKELINQSSVIVIGPGLTMKQWGRLFFSEILKSNKPLVLDADALNLLVELKIDFGKNNWVLTPHPGEAARLLDCTVKNIQHDRFKVIAELQKKYSGFIVLKGSGSLVMSPDKSMSICTDGNPGMATGGMGDILTGVIAGLIAQQFEMNVAIPLAVCIHSKAADMAVTTGERGLLATDLLPHLRKLMNPLMLKKTSEEVL
ncbi:MAG: NAD(P)H-hydrate dehydratase [Methylococcales bacterium]|nr:NAD(P)H-hydrate dehydratase [Methylococcales bacterium]MBT7410019.1 NAD(P)H-hydrate dehydratase [Methylococcales bacterium]